MIGKLREKDIEIITFVVVQAGDWPSHAKRCRVSVPLMETKCRILELWEECMWGMNIGCWLKKCYGRTFRFFHWASQVTHEWQASKLCKFKTMVFTFGAKIKKLHCTCSGTTNARPITGTRLRRRWCNNINTSKNVCQTNSLSRWQENDYIHTYRCLCS